MKALLLAVLAAAPVDSQPPPAGPPTTKRLQLAGGEPIIPVRLMEGQTELVFSSKGKLRLKLPGETERAIEGPEGKIWRVKLLKGTPAAIVAWVQVMELRDRSGLAEALGEWRAKGLKLRAKVLGGVFGIGGKVVDNRRYALVVDQPPKPPQDLEALQAELLTRFSVRTTLLEEPGAPARISYALLDDTGASVASGEGMLSVESLDGAPIEVRRVEYGVGYDFHNFEDRAYRGALLIIGDSKGTLAVINQVPLEALLKGLVPSEIFAKAHAEALKAQAVTARGEVLAKVGLKHLADPYLLCTEQHCAVYRGVVGEAQSTSAAVEATRGEALFDAKGRLVDSVYSAVCGGHTEHNDVVWGGAPSESLRGVPDVIDVTKVTTSPAKLSAFLRTEAPHACRLSSFAQPTKYRWERRFTAEELDAKLLAAGHAVGKVFALTPAERGISGRVRLLTVSGEAGATQLRGELTIRRTFGNLSSSMFEVTAEKDAKGRPVAWTFVGGGWGHGVGMCQTGAIGRAEAGQSYRQILGHYFNGAKIDRMY